ncbi:DUF4160 domain-containing protein [Rhodobacteraceae bacterium CH30]|uniref:DUF4160 domain-containing protein n=2 Tax=Craterilacuibacter sinensis TaxID=2686017 RepID=A0A845BJ70_9NEIS|nr:DUF4160 domain-containing protein [Craterilacuibacter sinensis]RQW24188.1 DUF4160 domain-containing protein [Rhodobacteraceae bacterium CH30]
MAFQRPCEVRRVKAAIDIQTLEVQQGKLPHRALTLVLEWAQAHLAKRLEDWELCRQMQHPKPIQPQE